MSLFGTWQRLRLPASPPDPSRPGGALRRGIALNVLDVVRRPGRAAVLALACLAVFSGAATQAYADAVEVSFEPIEGRTDVNARTQWVKEESGTHDLKVTLNPAPTSDLTVTYTVGGNANSGSDYTPLSGILSVPAGTTTATIPVTIIDDNVREAAEEIAVWLNDPVVGSAAYRLGRPSSHHLIIDPSDGPPWVSFARASGSVDEGSGTHNVRVRLNPAPSSHFTLAYTVDGTATSGSDYTALSGTLSVAKGATTATIPVTIIDDSVPEGSETVVLKLIGSSGYRVESPGTHTLTIAASDKPTVSFASASGSADEGSGTRNVKVNLTTAPASDITLAYTVSGTATSGSDYTALSGTLSVAKGATTATIPVTIIDDSVPEGSETVVLKLIGSSGYRVENPGTHTLTIAASDKPTVSFASASGSADEGSGTRNVKVNLTTAPASDITLAYTVDGTATSGSDYTALSGTLSVAKGATTATIPVTIIDDSVPEGSETVVLKLIGSSGYRVESPGTHTLTIFDDETLPTVSVVLPVAGFGRNKWNKWMKDVYEWSGMHNFKVKLDPPPTSPITLNYRVYDSTANESVILGSDYVVPSSPLSVPAGAKTATIPVTIIDDDELESPESFTLKLLDGTGYQVNHPQYLSILILRSDTPPRVYFTTDSLTAAEGSETQELKLGLSHPHDNELTVNYFLNREGCLGNRRTPTPGSDYVALSGTVTVPRGTTSATVPLTIIDDGVPEGDECLRLYLGTSTGTGTGYKILHIPLWSEFAGVEVTITDGPTRTVSFASASHSADEGSGTSNVTVNLSPAPTADITLAYTVEGTAASGSDYTALPGTVSVPKDATTATIPVALIDDSVHENGETVVLKLAAGEGYGVGSPGTHTLTIADNDPAPASLPAVSVAAGADATEGGDAVFTVTADPAPASPLAVTVTVAADGDYGIADGERTVTLSTSGSETLTLATTNDDADEPDGSVSVTVAAGDGYTVGAPASGTVAIADDDPAPPSVATVDPVLVAKVRALAEQTHHGTAHVTRWRRVLVAFGAEAYPGLSPTTAAEAEANAQKYSSPLWPQIAEVLAELEAAPEPQQQPGPLPAVSVSAGAAVTEGGDAVFTLTASPAPASPLAVSLTVAAAGDYGIVAGSQTVTIPTAGSATLTLATANDEVDEPDGTVTAVLAAGTGYTVSATAGSAGVAVTDDDATAVTLSAPAGAIVEGSGRKTLTLVLGRALVAGESVTVPLTLGGAAALGSDYTLAAPDATPQGVSYADLGSTDAAHPPAVTFTGPSATAATVVAAAVADAADEGGAGEQVTVAPGTLEATGLGGGASGAGSVAFAIVEPAPVVADDDAPVPTPTGVPPALIAEVKGHIAHFKARNHGAGVRDWTLVLDRLEGRTGMSDADIAAWLARSRQYGWQDGIQTLPKVQAALAALAAVPQQQQPATLPVVTIAADAASVTEGETAAFTLTATPPPPADLTVTVGVSAAGDYGVVAEIRTVTIPTAGSFTLTLATTGDATDEPDGSVTVTVADGAGYTVGSSASGTVAVQDDDEPQQQPATLPVVTIAADAASVTEGGTAAFTLTAAPPPPADLTVTVGVAATGDYGIAGESRTVTIPTTGSFVLTLATTGDTTDEPDGSVTVTVADGPGYTVGSPASGTVAVRDDDEPLPEVTIAAGDAVTEGGDAVFTLTASPLPASPLAVSVTVAADGDYGIAGASRTVTIPTAGSFTLTLATADDTADEPDGSVTVTVNDGAGYTVGSSASGTVPVRDDDLPPPAVSITAAAASVTEGGAASFTVSADRAPDADLTVTLSVTEAAGSDHVAADDEGTATVTIAKGTTEAAFSVATVDDAVDEPDGSVTVTVKDGAGYTVSSSRGAATVSVSDDDAAAGPVLSVDDATERESGQRYGNSLMEFTVRLSAAAAQTVRVRASTRVSSPVSARPREDYWPLRPELVKFYPGQTSKQVYILIFNDSHDEDPETFEVVLSDADGATIGDGVAVGTIVNDDPMPAAWLARFGRTVAEQALDGIAGRMAAPRTAGMQGTLAGQALSFDPAANDNPESRGAGPGLRAGGAGAAPAHAPDGAAVPGGTGALALADVAQAFGGQSGHSGPAGFGHDAAGFANGTQPRGMTGREALLGSSFSLTGATDGSGGSMAFWGRAAQGSFDGREGTFSLDGAVTTGMLGADYARGKWLVGLALAQSEGEGDYRDSDVSPRPDGQTCPDGGDGPLCGDAVRAGDGSVEASLTAAIPYAALQASERLKLWGAAGYGTGEVTLKTALGGSYKADTSWSMAAAGLRGDLLAPPAEGSGPALAVTSDALWTRSSSEKTDQLAASDSDATRLRLGLEGSYRMALESGGHVTPKLEVGARHDGGDAETGFGVELGGGIAWVDPGLGLSLDVSGRTLIAHGNDDLKDRGYAASLAFDPDPATQRGPSLSLRQEFGGQAQGGLDALFAPNPLEDRTGGEASSRWTAEAAYGLPAFGGRWTGSPHVGLGFATRARDYSLGWRLTPAANANAPDVSFGLRATRRESDTPQAEHTVGVEATMRW